MQVIQTFTGSIDTIHLGAFSTIIFSFIQCAILLGIFSSSILSNIIRGDLHAPINSLDLVTRLSLCSVQLKREIPVDKEDIQQAELFGYAYSKQLVLSENQHFQSVSVLGIKRSNERQSCTTNSRQQRHDPQAPEREGCLVRSGNVFSLLHSVSPTSSLPGRRQHNVFRLRPLQLDRSRREFTEEEHIYYLEERESFVGSLRPCYQREPHLYQENS